MTTIFPAANARTPDLYNLIRIHEEVRLMEKEVLDARYLGQREVTIVDTNFTDTNIATALELDNTVVGTADFTTTTEATVDPGDTLFYNATALLFSVIVDGTQQFADTDAVFPLSVGGNLDIGSATSVALTNTMTLDEIVDAINAEESTTGISASAVQDTGTTNYFLRLDKDNTVELSTLDILGSSNATVLTELGLVAASYVVDIQDVADQIGTNGSVAGAGPYNIQIDNSSGVYIRGGTALTTLGLTESVDLAADTISITGHGLTNGDQVSVSSPGTLPVPLNDFPDSFYYAIVVDANTIRLATTRQRALENLYIDITQQGTDYFTVKSTTDAEVYYQVWYGNAKNTVFEQRLDQVETYFKEKQYIIYPQTNPTTNLTLQWVIKW